MNDDERNDKKSVNALIHDTVAELLHSPTVHDRTHDADTEFALYLLRMTLMHTAKKMFSDS